jgi:hypothetical protein
MSGCGVKIVTLRPQRRRSRAALDGFPRDKKNKNGGAGPILADGGLPPSLIVALAHGPSHTQHVRQIHDFVRVATQARHCPFCFIDHAVSNNHK